MLREAENRFPLTCSEFLINARAKSDSVSVTGREIAGGLPEVSRGVHFLLMSASPRHELARKPFPWATFQLGWLFFGMLAVTQAALAAGSPSVSIKTNYYAVGGTNVMLIRNSMFATRPFAPTNAFDAFTHWTVRADYQFRPSRGSWVLHNPRVNLSITVTLPRWIPGLPVSPGLVQTWNEYLTNLTTHEAGHVKIGFEASEEVQRRLEGMPGYATASDARGAAAALVNELIDEFRAREREYDRQTRHGRSQGAVLRPPRPIGSPGKT
jgi:predicted secreted Zn-dependent protease